MKAVLILSVLAAPLIPALLWAHHGTSMYDMNTERILSGTVKAWTFQNPHSWLWLTVTLPQGRTEEWSIESAPPSYLARQGWSVSTVKPGEKITAVISPERTEPKRGILLELKRTNGTVLMVRPRGSFGRPGQIPR